MKEIKRRLATAWTISDKGPIKWVLNLRVKRDRPAGLMKLEQSAYVERKMREFGIDHLPAKSLPMRPTDRMSVSMCPKTEADKAAALKLPYRSRVGSLNYLRLTKPDMMCCNSILSQFNKEWGQPHYDATTYAWQYANAYKHWVCCSARVVGNLAIWSALQCGWTLVLHLVLIPEGAEEVFSFSSMEIS